MAKQITLKQFQNRMRKADQRLVKVLFERLKVLSLKAEAEAKRNVTDYPRVRTGRLRSSITGLVSTKDARPRMILMAGGNTKGAPVRYAKFVEFGTRYMQPRLCMGRAMKEVATNDVVKELRNLLSLSVEGR